MKKLSLLLSVVLFSSAALFAGDDKKEKKESCKKESSCCANKKAAKEGKEVSEAKAVEANTNSNTQVLRADRQLKQLSSNELTPAATKGEVSAKQ